MQILRGHRSAVRDLTFVATEPVPTLVSIAGQEQRVSVWDLEAGGREFLIGAESSPQALASSPKDGRVAAWLGFGDRVVEWSLSDPETAIARKPKSTDSIWPAMLLVTTTDGTEMRFDPVEGDPSLELSENLWGDINWVRAMSEQPNTEPSGRKGEGEQSLSMYYHVIGSVVHCSPRQGNSLSHCRWSLCGGHCGDRGPAESRVQAFVSLPDGSAFLVGHDDGTLRLFESDTGTLLSTWQFDIGPIASLAVSDDGRLFAAGGSRHIVVWDAEI